MHMVNIQSNMFTYDIASYFHCSWNQSKLSDTCLYRQHEPSQAARFFETEQNNTWNA